MTRSWLKSILLLLDLIDFLIRLVLLHPLSWAFGSHLGVDLILAWAYSIFISTVMHIFSVLLPN